MIPLVLLALIGVGAVLRWAVVTDRGWQNAPVDPATEAWLISIAAVENDPETVARLEAWRIAQNRLARGERARIAISYPATDLECAS